MKNLFFRAYFISPTTSPMKQLGRNLFNLITLLLLCTNQLWGQIEPVLATPPVGQLYEEGLVYVKIKEGTTETFSLTSNPAGVDALFSAYGVTLVERPYVEMPSAFLQKCYRLSFDPTKVEEDFVSSLAALNFVEYAERVPHYELFTVVPNDPALSTSNPSQNYHLRLANVYSSTSVAAYDIFPYNAATAASGAIVAITDDAVLTSHEDFANLVAGYDVASNDNNPMPPLTGSAVNPSYFSHGTHVGAIACARMNNALGVGSTGWNTRMMPIKMGADNNAALTNTFSAISWAATHGAKVINMSWGGAAASLTDYTVLVTAKNMGVILIASAGNSGVSTATYPAAYGEGLTGQSWEAFDKQLVIAVTALDDNNNKATWPNPFSGPGPNFGTWVDIAAYGQDIYSAVGNASGGLAINNGYGTKSGTSMAAPMVAGLAGNMWTLKPTATRQQIIDCLLSTANPDIYGPTHPSNIPGYLGVGRIDAYEALRCVSTSCTSWAAYISPSQPVICPNASTTLTVVLGSSFSWSNGATTQSTTVTQPGIYTCTVTNSNGCTSVASVNVLPVTTGAVVAIENSGIPNDGNYCGADDFVTIIAPPGLSYQWSAFGSTASSISFNMGFAQGITSPSTFTFTVTVTGIGGCVGVTSSAAYTGTVFPEPDVTINASTLQVCSGNSVTLNAVGTSDVISYLWSNSSTTSSIVIVPSPPSTTYTVTATTVNGCNATASKTISVLTTNGISGNSSICAGQSTTLSACGSGPFLWSTGQTTASITVSPTVNTVYSLTVNGTTYNKTVTVNTPPSLALSVPASPNCNTNTYLLNIVNPLNTVTYNWYANGLYMGNQPMLWVVANNTYTVVATDQNGCTASASTAVTTLAPIITIQGSTSFCPGGQTILTASGGGTYAWSNGVNTASNTITTPGGYSVTVTGTNGCTAVKYINVTLRPVPTLTTAIQGLTPQGALCSGNNNSITVFGANTYSWSTTATVPSIAVTSSGTYIVTGTNGFGCTASAAIPITITASPTVAISGNSSVCQGSSVILQANVTNPSSPTYSWSNSGGSGVSATYIPTSNTTYTVTVTNNNGCTASASKNVSTLAAPIISIQGVTSFCAGGQTVLTATGGSAYVWSNGPTTATNTVNTAGVYTVVATGANGCTGSASVTVTQGAGFTLSTMVQGNLCSNGNNTITASGAVSYSWSTNATTPTIVVTASGTYSVTGTNSVGCSASASIPITIAPAPVVSIIGNSSICQGSPVLLQATTNASSPTYLWSNGGGTASAATFTPTSVGNTIYTVNVTGSNGCSTIAQYTVQSVNSALCCSAPAGYISVGAPGTTTLLSSLVPATPTPGMLATVTNAASTPQTVFIQGTLMIDVNYPFVSSNIQMGAGADIIIPNAKTLTLKATNVSAACNKLWRNIQVQAGGRLVCDILSGTPTVIRNAQYAIRAEHKSQIILSATQFRGNFIGIYAPAPASGGNSSVTSTLKSLVFDGNDPLLSTAGLGLPTTPIVYTPLGINSNLSVLDKPFAGVLMVNQEVPQSLSNARFSSLQQGAIYVNSVSITHQYVDLISTLTSRGYPLNTNITGLNLIGVGICNLGNSASASSLDVINSTQPGTPNISALYGGVFAHRTKLNVLNQRISTYLGQTIPSYGIYGISSYTDVATTTNGLYNNNISTDEYGIRWNQHIGKYRIVRNIITVNNATTNAVDNLYAGISLRGTSPTLHEVNIADNIINLQGVGVRRGIDASVVNTLRIFNNSVSIQQSACNVPAALNYQARAGINVEGSNSNFINCNTVYTGSAYQPSVVLATGTTPNLNRWVGIRIKTCPSTFVSKNTTDGTLTGLFIDGTCTNSTFRGNKFERHFWALWCGKTAIFPNQNFRGNLWRVLGTLTKDYDDWGAAIGGSNWAMARSSVPTVAALSNIYFRTTHTGYTPPTGYLYTPPAGAFVMTAGTSTQWFNVSTPPITAPWDGTGWTCTSTSLLNQLTPQEEVYALGDYAFDAFSAERNWTEDKELYEKLKIYPSLINAPYDQFIINKQARTEGLLYNVRSKQRDALAVADDYFTSLDAQNLLTQNNINQYMALYEAFEDSNDSTYLLQMEEQLDLIYQSVADYSNLMDNLKTDYNNVRTTANNANLSITVVTVPETNQKAINSISLATIYTGLSAFRNEEYTSLNSIAGQCPLAGGNAVFEARALLAAYSNIAYDDDALCASGGKSAIIESASNLELYPNPSNEEVTIKYPLLEQDCVLFITDLQGKVVVQQALSKDSNQVSLPTSNLPNGLYIVNCSANLNWVSKLVIIH